MSEFLSLLKKELKSVAQEKTIVSAILVQFIIASLSSVILTGILAFYDPVSLVETSRFTPRVGYVGDMGSPLVEYLRSSKIAVRPITDPAAAENAFLAHRVDAVMLVPESASGTVEMKLILPEMEAARIFVLVMLDKPLKEYENYLREANGISIGYRDVKGKPYSGFELLHGVIVPILMLFPSLVAGSMVIDTVSEEFENKTFETLMSTPVSPGKLFSAKISSAIVLALIQLVLWIGLLKANGLEISSPALLFMVSGILTFTIALGACAIIILFSDRERAQFVYSMTLIITGAAVYFLNISPISLLTKLSAGVPGVGLSQVALYSLPLVAIALLLNKIFIWQKYK
jgi:ABC-2 type transport system permease protein